MRIKFLLFVQILSLGIFGQAEELKIAFWTDPVQTSIVDDIANALKELVIMHSDFKIQDFLLSIDKEDSDNATRTMEKLCKMLSTEGVAVVLDFTYQDWQEGINLVHAAQIPYVRVERPLAPFMHIFGEFLQLKEANDVVMIFQNAQDHEEALYHIVEGYPFRTIIINAADDVDFVDRLHQLRPTPTYFGVFARGTNMNSIFQKIDNGSLFVRPTEWHFVFLDPRDRVFKFKKQVELATKFTINSRSLCKSLQMKDVYCQSGFMFQRAMLMDIMRSLINMRQIQPNVLPTLHVDCKRPDQSIDGARNFDILEQLPLSNFLVWDTRRLSYEEPDAIPKLTFAVNVSINFFSNQHEAVTDLAVWQDGTLRKINETITKSKEFFRIGVAEAIPWSYYRRNAHTGELILDSNGKPIWEGYCIDMIITLAKKLNFDYELVPPTSGKFGKRDPVTGSWNGIVGDLASGETDFAVTALKMYSDREEVIDFIAPYFDQTGISIVIRKPVRQTSLFKFMTVLRVEVWFSIIGALVATAIMIWLLDKYSPYSSRNNKNAYPYPCREFTLRESFWFALTSFTPQGGGEAPKAVSGRILVAAYWLFVVLMLATFTANLAAFLTVERMQTPVQSLEQLARQSRINYTVVANSDTHQYFINMKFAEDTLYRMWKELSLNASEDYHKFRIWDYPIKEQYGHILLAINGSNPVRDAAEGFRLVDEHENADFAFIHDSAEIKYELTRNCNLTEVGEIFAEQPYAIAVQQGSHLNDELSYAILELQKDRYFEELKAKYWNRTKMRDCARSEDQGGITLESLGGVFLATLFGLILAMVTLALEVLYYKRKHDNTKGQFGEITKVKPLADVVPKPRLNAWHVDGNKKSSMKLTPPPSFEAAVTTKMGKKRKQNVPSTITLGGEEFKPVRFGLRARRDLRADNSYVE